MASSMASSMATPAVRPCTIFYRKSLHMACDEINTRRQIKRLKDVVGAAFETHRKRIWEHYGFTVDKNRRDASWNVDWSITNANGQVVAFEEDKGHYVDSCFLERLLVGAARTVNTYQNNGNDVPHIILHSFTTYARYQERMNEFCNILKPEIVTELRNKLKYTALRHGDRMSKNLWFCQQGDEREPYINHADEELIQSDIEFIQSLA